MGITKEYLVVAISISNPATTSYFGKIIGFFICRIKEFAETNFLFSIFEGMRCDFFFEINTGVF